VILEDTMILKPFFSYFGSKYRISKHYPSPNKDILIEPFAGSACYSLHYHWKKVMLFDKYDVVCGVWDYLIHTKQSEILALPLIDFDKTLDDYNLCQEAKWLIGFWLHLSNPKPGIKHTSRAIKVSTGFIDKNGKKEKPRNFCSWTIENKNKIASQVEHIRHWEIKQDSYENINNEQATWFIDPPYQIAGKGYKESSKNIDFDHLANWCQNRQGEVVVCENQGADWLPFEPFSSLRNARRRQTQEVVYYQGFENQSEQITLF